LLSHGRSMMNYESYPISFQLLQVNSVSWKH
jgi:hypothetical protein